MKIRKSELKNIIDRGFAERRAKAKIRQKKGSEATKAWKLRMSEAASLLNRLEKSTNPHDQADKFVIKELLKKIKYNF